MKTWSRVAPGIYRHSSGSLYCRPTVNGKPTFRRLAARTVKLAREELAAKQTDQARSAFGLAADPYSVNVTVGRLVDDYIKAGCPDARRVPRTGKSLAQEESRLKQLRPWWENIKPQHIDIRTLDASYAGLALVDEQTISNLPPVAGDPSLVEASPKHPQQGGILHSRIDYQRRWREATAKNHGSIVGIITQGIGIELSLRTQAHNRGPVEGATTKLMRRKSNCGVSNGVNAIARNGERKNRSGELTIQRWNGLQSTEGGCEKVLQKINESLIGLLKPLLNRTGLGVFIAGNECAEKTRRWTTLLRLPVAVIMQAQTLFHPVANAIDAKGLRACMNGISLSSDSLCSSNWRLS